VPATRLANGRPRDQRAPRVPGQWSPSCTGLSSAPPDCPVCHGTRGWQWSASPNKERNHTLFTARCAPDSPVRPRTEGNQSLPNGEATTPFAIGAIKGAPRCLYQDTKHQHPTTPRHYDHAIDLLDRDLSTCLSYNSAALSHVLFSRLVCVLL
jgi:hypothetical protein